MDYTDIGGRFPGSLRLESQSAGPRVDIALTISQLETNVDLDPAAFRVNEPPDARPMTLEELRAAGPLQGS